MGTLDQVQQEYDQWYSNAKPGDTYDFAGGKISFGQGGGLWTNPSGETTLFQKDSDLNKIALENKAIANAWGSQYGFTPEEPPKEPEEETPQIDVTDLFSTYQNQAPSASPAKTVSGNTANYQQPAGASVAERMNDLLNTNNPFIQRARTSVAQRAEASGNRNSLMAQTAGESAAIDAAYNVASKDAELYSNLYSQERGAELESALSAQNAEQQGWLYNIQGDITAGLSQLDAAQQMLLQSTLKKMDADQQMEMARFEAETASKLSAQEAAQARMGKIAEIEATNQWEQTFLDAKIALENQGATAEAVDAIQNDFTDSWIEIILNPHFATPEDRQWALQELINNTQTRINTVADIYSVPIEWEPSANLFGTGTASTTGTFSIDKYLESIKKDISYNNMTLQSRQSFDSLTSAVNDDYIKEYMNILSSPDYESSQQRKDAITELEEKTRKQYITIANNFAELYGVDLTANDFAELYGGS